MYNQNSENNIENKDLFDERLDIKSPYIKTGNYNLDEVRSRIAKRAYSNGENFDILDVKDKKESDSLLYKKINNTVKKIAGGEIKKFAEIAGREISKEFDNLETRLESRLEKKLDYIEQNTYDHFSIQKENLSKLEMSFNEKLEKEMSRLNSTIEEMEKRIQDLEIFSLSGQNSFKKEEEKEEFNDEYEFKIENSNKNFETLEIMKDTLKEETKIENTLNDKNIELSEYAKEEGEIEKEINNTNQAEYINNEIKKIAESFEKEGLLFKRNFFLSTIKNLNIKKLKENKIDLNSSDKEKITKIITDLENETKIQNSKKENVEEFLERAFKIKYLNKK